MNSASIMSVVVSGLIGIGVLAIVYFFIKIVNDKTNHLEWYHLISVKAHDGQQYASWNQIGSGAGVVLCIWLPAVYAYSDRVDAVGLASILGVALAYLGGVSGYAATLRARRGTTETTRVEEDMPKGTDKRITETIKEIPPV